MARWQRCAQTCLRNTQAGRLNIYASLAGRLSAIRHHVSAMCSSMIRWDFVMVCCAKYRRQPSLGFRWLGLVLGIGLRCDSKNEDERKQNDYKHAFIITESPAFTG